MSQVVSNPPGLTQISDRVDDFAGFRQALLRPLPGEQAIGPWRPAPGDLGLQVLEWWAYLGDVLTFYNERIANESYLRTATQPVSVANLVALLGYQPAPGLGATGTLAAVRSPASPASPASTEPLVIPAGLPVASVATSGVPSQTFEASTTSSYTGPSSLPVTLAPDRALTAGPDGGVQSALLAGPVSGIGAGDRLLLACSAYAGQDDNWSLVTVGSVTPAPDPGTGVTNTLVGFSASTQGLAGASYRLLRASGAAALWNRGTPVSGDQVVVGAGQSLAVHLSAAVRGISPGDTVLFDGGPLAPSALAVVSGTAEVLWAVPFPVAPGMSGPNPPDVIVPHTVLTVTTADGAVLEQADPAAVTLRYGFTDTGTLTGVPAASLASLPVTAMIPSAPPPGTTALLVDATGAGVLVTVAGTGSGTNTGQVTLAGAGTPPSVIAAPMIVPLQLLTNLLPVSRGTTVTGEVLGSGNAALASQSFTLANAPLTYLAGPGGPVSTLAVYVDGVAWQEVPSFYGQATDARVFTVSRSPDQTVTTVTFGDGINGARLTSGTQNVTATYRYGSGAASPPAGRLTTILAPQPNLASVQNPVAVSGGADPQPPADVRANAPASVLTFGRAVSAADYEAIAASSPGVTRVAASWTLAGATVYVDGGQAAAVAANAALADAAAPDAPLLVRAATPVELALSGTLVVTAGWQAAAVTAAAVTALADPAAGLFSPGRMGIGQRLYRSAVDAALMVPGVVAVHDLVISWPGGKLGEFADPGQGSFFDLQPANIAIGGTSASG
jgi:hypothetical protein